MTSNAAQVFPVSDDDGFSRVVTRPRIAALTPIGASSEISRLPLPGATRARPELAGALETIAKAADLIASHKEQARKAKQETSEAAEKLTTALCQIDTIMARALTAEEGVRVLTGQIDDLKFEAASKAHELNGRISWTEERERQAADELARANDLLRAADYRVFAAETRAMEAQEDITYLVGSIRSMLDLAERLLEPATE